MNTWLLGLALVCDFGQISTAGLIEYVTEADSSTVGGKVSAIADFTLGNGTLTLTLTNNLSNPTADSQLISGISFDISGASGSGGLKSVNSGITASIVKGQAASILSANDPLSRWQATKSENKISLTTLSGGTPDLLIIGPGASGTGTYSNVNPSITGNHNPSVLDAATFTISIAGITSSSTLSDVSLLFGTGGFGMANETVELTLSSAQSSGGSSGQNSSSAAVPEPSSLALLGIGGIVMAIRAYRRGRRLAVSLR